MALIEEDFDKSLKVIVVGNGTVGKSSLITRFANRTYTSGYKKTLAVDFVEKAAQIKTKDGEEDLTFLLWDTAGQVSSQGLGHFVLDTNKRGWQYFFLCPLAHRGRGLCALALCTVQRVNEEANNCRLASYTFFSG